MIKEVLTNFCTLGKSNSSLTFILPNLASASTLGLILNLAPSSTEVFN
nr:hypothetical protein [Campylobacter jejuni]